MYDACRYVDRPFAFIFRYVRLRTFSHAVIGAAVLAAVACSVTTQYGLKHLVLILILLVYSFFGAFLFYAIEEPHQRSVKSAWTTDLSRKRADFVDSDF